MSQNISSTEIATLNFELDEKIKRIAASLVRLSDPLSDYHIRIVFEAYEITGIWIDSVWLSSPLLSRSVCIFSLYTFEDVMEYGTFRREYLSRDDTCALKRFLKSVHFQPAPVFAY